MKRDPDSAFEVLPWDVEGNTLVLNYGSRLGPMSERIEFDARIEVTDTANHIIDMLALVCAVSYVKASGESTVDAGRFTIPPRSIEMVTAIYDDGMAEFAHTNGIQRRPVFGLTTGANNPTIQIPDEPAKEPTSLLIPIGGGKDSAVLASALATLDPMLLSVGHNRFVDRISSEMDLRIRVVTRVIDPSLLAANAAGAPNGHVPVTAINSLIAVLFAELNGHDAVVMANEAASSEPTRMDQGRLINHQFSKSLEFEGLLRSAIAESGSSVDYFSALRDRDDRSIARVFAERCTRLHPHFMSCNKAMVRDERKRSQGWCNQCPKCRSVFLSLAPHLAPEEMTSIFGRDLLDDDSQIDGFKELLDPGNKPFECVADVISATNAMVELRHSASWSRHRVVEAIEPLVSTSGTGPSTDPTHHVPAGLHAMIEGFFTQ